MKLNKKEQCNHNAIAKGNGEDGYCCISCGEKVKTPILKEQSDWEKEFDLQPFDLVDPIEKIEKIEKIKSFIFAQIQQARAEGYEEGTKGLPSKGVEEYEREIRQETLKEAIAYLKKKNPVRVPSSVMVDYTEAITDLESLLKNQVNP